MMWLGAVRGCLCDLPKETEQGRTELRPESTALAVYSLRPLVELCWARGRGSRLHIRAGAQSPDGPAGRAG